ncbi:MAG: hypothetical protein AB1489_17920 [Acidobacteriota bacterium]
MNAIKHITTSVYVRLVLGLALAMVFTLTGKSDEQGQIDLQAQNNFCSQTARLLFKACKAEVKDNLFKKEAICINISDAKKREECLKQLAEERKESNQLCQEMLNGRLAACKSIGENRYDPDISPSLFDTDFTNLTKPNPYFPLKIGNRWEYRGGNEVNIVENLNQTKLIAGVRCIVVNDQVFKDGELAEDTDDWFAQAKDGNVWYFGEEVKDFDSFNGDNPKMPELVSIDGSFKFGREGDKGGLFFLIAPKPGDAYYEEFSLGNAEDITEILSTTYSFGSNSELDQFVPRALVERFCAGDCIVTKNFSLLEPGIFARKYYAKGIGVFLEVKPDTRETIQLVDCNFDPRCANLPKPAVRTRH